MSDPTIYTALTLKISREVFTFSFTFTYTSLQVCGNLMSDAFGVNGVGASTSCYGLIGVQVGRLFLVEWHSGQLTDQ